MHGFWGSSLSITEIGHGSNLSTQKVEVRELEVHDHLQQLHSYLNVSLGQIRPWKEREREGERDRGRKREQDHECVCVIYIYLYVCIYTKQINVIKKFKWIKGEKRKEKNSILEALMLHLFVKSEIQEMKKRFLWSVSSKHELYFHAPPRCSRWEEFTSAYSLSLAVAIQLKV